MTILSITRRRWAAACTMLFMAHPALAQSTSEEAEARFKRALEQREQGDYQSSIESLQGILANQPSLGRARIELALSYFKALNFAAAKAEAERVLSDPHTPEAVRVTIRDLLSAIARDAQPHEFTPFVTLGVLHDSNINAGPGSDTINIDGASLTLTPGSTKRSDTALVLYTGVSHRYLLPTTVAAFGSNAAAFWQTTGSYYQTDYRATNDFDLRVLTLSTGPALVVPQRWRASLPVQYDAIDLGHTRTAAYLGVSPTFTWIVGKTELTLDAQYQTRRYVQTANAGRNSGYQSLGVSLAHLLGNDKISMQAGFKGFTEHASEARYTNRGDESYLGIGWRPWSGGSLFARISRKNVRHSGEEPLFALARKEREVRHVLGGSHEFNGGMLDKWLLTLNHTITRNRSNVAIYTYDRDQTMLTLGRSF